MKHLSKQKFHGIIDWGPNTFIENMIYDKCSFTSCDFSINENINHRSIVKNVTLKNCEQKSCIVKGGILENVLIENLKTRSLTQTWGTFFKNVTFKGKMGRIMITNSSFPTEEKDFQKKNYDANLELFQNTDWCLDISQAKFQEFTLRGIPSKFVIRDPDTQVVVSKESLKKLDFEEFNFETTYYKTSLTLFSESNYTDIILAAPLMDKKNVSTFLNVIDRLVSEKIAFR